MGIFKDMSDELDRLTADIHGGTRLTKRYTERARPIPATHEVWALELFDLGGAAVARFAWFGTGEDALRAALEHYRERTKRHAEAAASSEAGREAASAIGTLVADVAEVVAGDGKGADVSSALLDVASKRAAAGLHEQIGHLLGRATDAELAILHERFGDKPEALLLIEAEEKKRSASPATPATA